MIEVEISRSGLDFEEAAEKLGGPLRQKLVERLAEIAWSRASYGAPWRTGKLAGSIVKVVGDGEAWIKALAPYAVFVEKGTAPHIITPVRASVLAFEVGGEMVFTGLVRHPGTKPNPFLQRAANEARASVDEIFADLWPELIG